MGLLLLTTPFDAAATEATPLAPLPGSLRDDGVDASLTLALLHGDAVALGRFQRAASAIDVAAVTARGLPIVRRSVGGPALRIGEGVLSLKLWLSAPEVLGGVPDVERALNRHVRPMLRALESLGVPATWGGRDLILVRGVPVAWVGIGHSVSARTTVIEAYFGLTRTFALDPELDLATGEIAPRYLGRVPKPLADLLRKREHDGLAKALVDAFTLAAEGDVRAVLTGGNPPSAPALPDEPPFTAMVEEAIGLLGARYEPEHERVAIGGDLGASEDALATLERALFAAGRDATEEQLGAIVDRHLGPTSGALVFGVKSLRSIAKAALHAIRQS